MQFNSALVNVGDTVKQDEPIGLSGKTGYTLFPHLHFQLMTGPSMNDEGLPSSFRSVTRMLGTRALADPEGLISSGDILVTD